MITDRLVLKYTLCVIILLEKLLPVRYGDKHQQEQLQGSYSLRMSGVTGGDVTCYTPNPLELLKSIEGAYNSSQPLIAICSLLAKPNKALRVVACMDFLDGSWRHLGAQKTLSQQQLAGTLGLRDTI